MLPLPLEQINPASVRVQLRTQSRVLILEIKARRVRLLLVVVVRGIILAVVHDLTTGIDHHVRMRAPVDDLHHGVGVRFPLSRLVLLVPPLLLQFGYRRQQLLFDLVLLRFLVGIIFGGGMDDVGAAGRRRRGGVAFVVRTSFLLLGRFGGRGRCGLRVVGRLRCLPVVGQCLGRQCLRRGLPLLLVLIILDHRIVIIVILVPPAIVLLVLLGIVLVLRQRTLEGTATIHILDDRPVRAPVDVLHVDQFLGRLRTTARRDGRALHRLRGPGEVGVPSMAGGGVVGVVDDDAGRR
mmetsp:Transcript_37733/g.90945  ORF Transcript_37733/g.90945 Transcript_37733/m.90945 type:complete len:294 (-) Transcript_37733:211-1092(-)